MAKIPARSLHFLPIPLLIAGLALWFTGRQLGLAFPLGGPGAWSAWAWAALLWAYPLSWFLFSFRAGSASRFQGPAFFLMGLGATLLVFLLLLKAANLGLGLFGYRLSPSAPWAALLLCLTLCLLGWRSAFAPALTRRLELKIKGLHPGLEGLRIAQISDLHITKLQGVAQIERLVAQVQELQPHLIAITGDLVDGSRKDLAQLAGPLSKLKAPLGLHYVTGNHEYFWNAGEWLEEFAGLGFELLTNAHRVLEHQGARLLVVGVNDPTAGRMAGMQGPDLEMALAGAPEADFTLFLAHQPSAFPLAHAAGADLFLAGHTHGGQFFPFQPIVSLFHKYFQGLYKAEGKLWIYVHPGSGFWGPPNRLGVPPEIALFELQAS